MPCTERPWWHPGLLPVSTPRRLPQHRPGAMTFLGPTPRWPHRLPNAPPSCCSHVPHQLPSRNQEGAASGTRANHLLSPKGAVECGSCACGMLGCQRHAQRWASGTPRYPPPPFSSMRRHHSTAQHRPPSATAATLLTLLAAWAGMCASQPAQLSAAAGGAPGAHARRQYPTGTPRPIFCTTNRHRH